MLKHIERPRPRWAPLTMNYDSRRALLTIYFHPTGLGAGMLYVPSMALVGLSFKKKRALAQGIVTSGIAVGASNPLCQFNQLC
jgi:MFS family permease